MGAVDKKLNNKINNRNKLFYLMKSKKEIKKKKSKKEINKKKSNKEIKKKKKKKLNLIEMLISKYLYTKIQLYL